MPRFASLAAALVLLAPDLAQAQSARDNPIQSGPMVGHVEMRNAQLWVQTTRAARVRFEYWDEAEPGKINTTTEVRTTRENAWVAKSATGLLEPGRTYRYAVVVDGRRVARPYPLKFQTPPLWQWRTDPPEFTVAVGSCAYINDPPFDRPGEPYGGDYQIFPSIAAKQPQVMIWLGDNCYLREADGGSRESVLYRYTHTRSLPEMQALLAASSHYAIWDDHDYGPNDSDRSNRDKVTTRAAFELFTANPTYGFPERPTLTTTMFSWGDVDFFLMDDRTDRAPNHRKTGERPFLGKPQLEWLIDSLITSTATLKIVCIGNQVLNPAADASVETYAHFAVEQKELLDHIATEGIRGVVFVTGDRHHAELTRMPREGTYPLYDLTTSPLTAGLSSKGENEGNTLRVPGTYLRARNFALLKFSGPRKDRVLTIQLCRTDGTVAWEQVIQARELQ